MQVDIYTSNIGGAGSNQEAFVEVSQLRAAPPFVTTAASPLELPLHSMLPSSGCLLLAGSPFELLTSVTTTADHWHFRLHWAAVARAPPAWVPRGNGNQHRTSSFARGPVYLLPPPSLCSTLIFQSVFPYLSTIYLIYLSVSRSFSLL